MEKTLFLHIVNIVLKNYKTLLIAFSLITFANILLISNPLLMRYALSLNDPNPWKWSFILLSIALASSCLRYLMRIAFIKVTREQERKIRTQIYSRVQSQSMTFFDRHGIGELTSRLSSDMSAYRDVLGPGILFPTYFLSTVVPGLCALFYLSIPMGLFALIPVLAIPIINFSLRGFVYRLSSAYQAKLAEMSNFTQETFQGIRIVKGFGVQTFLYDQFFKFATSLKKLNLPLMTYQGLFFPFLTLITRITTCLLVMLTGYLILNHVEFISPSDFIAFMWIQSYIFFPVLILGWVLPIYQQGRAAYDRLKSIYDEPIDIKEGSAQHKIPAKAAIDFNHLSFTYYGEPKPALNDITLHLEGGKFIGITGPSGGGKSTLFKLLNREYEIPRGMISIGGKDIHDYPVENFYQEMVTVEQIPFLFSKTIRENVRFGNELASQEEIERAAKMADLHETVISFQEGYETVVGERGITLSGGQKQRVAIARAFLVNRAILLLDDIFSSVDSGTEARIFNDLKGKFKGKTVLISTQRISTLEQLDFVIYLSEGKVIESGPPQELIERGGKLKTLKELDSLIKWKSTK